MPADPATRILHVADTAEWTAARAAGLYTTSSRGRSLAEEGFIHACTARQAPGVLERYYADLPPSSLTLLVLDVDALSAAGSPVRWDEVVPGEPPFPHVYGPIVPTAVVGELALTGIPGHVRLPDLEPWRVTSG